jgi:hypothetical protein
MNLDHSQFTKGDAVGWSRIPISSGENGKRGITNVCSGTNDRMMMGNTTAAGTTHKQQNKTNKPFGPIRRMVSQHVRKWEGLEGTGIPH